MRACWVALVFVLPVPILVFAGAYTAGHGVEAQRALHPVKRSTIVEVRRRSDGGFEKTEEESGGGFPRRGAPTMS